MRTSCCLPSLLILAILRGSAVCISGRSVCGADVWMLMKASGRRNQVKTSFVLHLGRPWLALGSSPRGDISVTVVGEKSIHMKTNRYINTVVSS